MVKSSGLVKKIRKYYFHFAILRDYWWVGSSQSERAVWVRENLQRTSSYLMLKVSCPYALYFMNPYADGLGLELFHALMLSSYRGRFEDYVGLCRYPMKMILLFGGLKLWVQHNTELPPTSLLWGAGFLLLSMFSYPLTLEWLNRHVLRGYLMRSQLRFEAWALLVAWQKREHPWFAASLSHDALSATLTQCLEEVKLYQTTRGAMSESEQSPGAEGSACLPFYEASYRSQMKFWSLINAGLFYGLLTWLSLDWVAWLMQPLTLLEQQWVSSL